MVVRSKCVTGPLDERVKDRIVGRDIAYGSSGSEHSGAGGQIGDYEDDDSSHSLSYLLHCFDEENEKDDVIEQDEFDGNCMKNNDPVPDPDSDSDSDRLEAKNEEMISTLRNLNNDMFRNVLLANVVKAMEFFRCLSPSTQILNRNVMRFLQKVGYNAAICKTKWQSCGGLTAGDYEFIDVVESGARYFIDLNFAGEFQIARQTNQFRRLAQNLPIVFVGKSADLKVIVKLMSDEIRRSLKSRGLVLPPWRKNRFMQNKWFGPYRRTANYTPSNFASSLTVPVNRMTDAVKCSMIGFSVVDSAPLFNAATRTR